MAITRSVRRIRSCAAVKVSPGGGLAERGKRRPGWSEKVRTGLGGDAGWKSSANKDTWVQPWCCMCYPTQPHYIRPTPHPTPNPITPDPISMYNIVLLNPQHPNPSHYIPPHPTPLRPHPRHPFHFPHPTTPRRPARTHHSTRMFLFPSHPTQPHSITPHVCVMSKLAANEVACLAKHRGLAHLQPHSRLKERLLVGPAEQRHRQSHPP